MKRPIRITAQVIAITLCLMALNSGCEEAEPEPEIQVSLPLDMLTVSEADGTLEIPVSLSETPAEALQISYELIGTGIDIGVDLVAPSGTLTIPAGEAGGLIALEILDDDEREANEEFILRIIDLPGYELGISSVKCLILDDDEAIAITDEGYEAASSYPGYELVWADEFDGNTLDSDNWTHEIGDNGWGNNEWQYYQPENTSVQDGYLVIEATETPAGSGKYYSSRIKSEDKQEFTFGRIDVRAKLPKGQGIWPAIWMLGADFSQVGWPACGEIDIMELVGHEPSTVHGTIHYGPAWPNNRYTGTSYTLDSGEFIDQFHVFSLIWKQNLLEFYVDDNLFQTLTPGDLGGQPWLFNKDFFFIMNCAVGGNWPGYPNATTIFPQLLVVDYVRVYQES
ncbi:family 16 glycosylhydrolase [Pontibacter sp. G13]|uniref:family 16 glycosylhydrolase n=1 Tax=Pontibacter sp. G13 TaxID=3074898 RepID=UPI00288C3B0D|nr:family 16 glycosylhydrolase [Pontibacter sp. G13]WNJ17071.1 family 16 glycosylhydrolase [Pontibacter sp. G13]